MSNKPVYNIMLAFVSLVQQRNIDNPIRYWGESLIRLYRPMNNDFEFVRSLGMFSYSKFKER